MQAAIRRNDRAILAVSRPIPPVNAGEAWGWTTIAPCEGTEIVTFTPSQMAHWLALDLPPGEVMALADDGSLYVLAYAPPDAAMLALRALLASHTDPLIRDAATRLGVFA